jgi:signal transduction histidine kinase
MNIYAIPPLLTAVILTIIGLFVFLKNKTSKLNIVFSLFSLSMVMWLFGYINMYLSKNPSIALKWARIGFLGIIFIPIFAYHFIISFLNLKRKTVLPIIYLLAIPSLLLSQTNYIYSGIKEHFWGYYPVAGRIYFVFLSMFGVLFTRGVLLLISYLRKESGLRRNQIKYVCLAFGLGTFGIVDYLVKYPIFDVYPFGYICALLFISLIAFAIVRHHLLDLNIALTRAGIFIAVYTFILGLPFAAGALLKSWLIEIFGAGWWMLPQGLTALLATLGPFIYIYLDRKAEERLLKEQRRYQNTLKQASMGMTRIRNLRKLLDLITHIVTKTVKIAYAGIYLYNEETNEFILQVCRDKGRIPVLKLTPDNPLISWMALKRQPLVYEEIKRLKEDNNDDTYRPLEENMRLLTATVIIPNFLEDRFLGFFVLGEKTSGQIYTPDDLNVFEVLAAQAALAIENAKFYEETQRMQEQIATAEKMATIGTMADGLSHQINNRFYALSLIAADTIDTIKMIDTSKCSPELKEGINQINHAMERIQQNVLQGGQVVKGMLKYTRKGEEGFEALTLDQILDSTLEMVQYKVKLSEIDIIRNYPKDTPKIRGNPVQLTEAFFNFIDNAYDAITERRDLLKEPNYRGRITIIAKPKTDSLLEITVEDNGMGIKDQDKKKLFTPFFTTKVSSRQGTGLGLYVLRRVIEEFHKGKIWFESEYGQGTKFFFQLPVTQKDAVNLK